LAVQKNRKLQFSLSLHSKSHISLTYLRLEILNHAGIIFYPLHFSYKVDPKLSSLYLQIASFKS